MLPVRCFFRNRVYGLHDEMISIANVRHPFACYIHFKNKIGHFLMVNNTLFSIFNVSDFYCRYACIHYFEYINRCILWCGRMVEPQQQQQQQTHPHYTEPIGDYANRAANITKWVTNNRRKRKKNTSKKWYRAQPMYFLMTPKSHFMSVDQSFDRAS